MDENLDLGISFDLPKNQSNVIKAIGVGGGGSNAINHMYRQGIKGVDFVICNTDAQALNNSGVPNKIQLGVNLTEGLGAGANPEIGEKAALESAEDIMAMLNVNTKMVFITAGMGGGTGTGAAPIIAQMAREMNILTVGIVTTPFSFEGKLRNDQAQAGIEKLRNHVDSLIIINNNKLREVYGNLGFKEGFSKADEVLATAAKGVAQVITHHYTQNIDLKDAKTVLSNSGTAIMGSSIASGSNRANEAVIKALDSPLLNDNKIEGSKNVLLLIISGSDEITIDEIGEINEHIQNETGNNANIIMGVGEDLDLGNNISVTIIATGFGDEKQKSLVNTETKKIIYTLDEDHPFERELIEDESYKNNEMIKDKNNKESSNNFKQKKIESEINEILRNIDISYEVVDAEQESEDINDIEVIDFEYVLPNNDLINESEEDFNEISFGLFSDNVEKEISKSNNVFSENNNVEENLKKDDVYSYEDEEDVEFIKLDLNDNEPKIETNDIKEEESTNLIQDDQENSHLFEEPINTDLNNENILRRENLKKYNHVFKSNNSSIEELEKIPAYKRMGIKINNSMSQDDKTFSKTILNEDNELEFPDVNTYLHDNVD